MFTTTNTNLKNFTSVKENLANKLNHFLHDNKDTSHSHFIRLEVPLQKLDIIQWLKNQNNEIKTYWRDRESKFEIAGLGEADMISGSLVPDYRALFLRLNEYLRYTDHNVRYYGGMRFNKKHNSDYKWQDFTSYRFIVPKFEICRAGTETKLACNLLIRKDENVAKIIRTALQELEHIDFDYAPTDHSFPDVIKRTDFPSFKRWQKNIAQALTAFRSKKLNKIVLARKTTLKFSDKINPMELLWKLRLNNHRAYYFCFQPCDDAAFIGGTPEQLYYRSQNRIHTEAVAGTRKRGHTKAEDIRLEEDLISCEKDIREHRFVVDSIRNSMKKLSTHIKEQDKISVLKLSRLQHLSMQFSGQLKSKIQDCDILESMHPTPAVGGVPSEKAQMEIENIEKFDRGWYAGPVGWISKDEAEFAVAIRSGLVFEDELHLHSGAGIVEGSDYENEWEEIESKIAGFMNALKEKKQEIHPSII
jgi:menaquinone-specific isochorismate synthase